MVVFENLQHDFPQRVGYRRTGADALARGSRAPIRDSHGASTMATAGLAANEDLVIGIESLHHVAVCVTDIARAKQFYGGVLGLTELTASAVRLWRRLVRHRRSAAAPHRAPADAHDARRFRHRCARWSSGDSCCELSGHWTSAQPRHRISGPAAEPDAVAADLRHRSRWQHRRVQCGYAVVSASWSWRVDLRGGRALTTVTTKGHEDHEGTKARIWPRRTRRTRRLFRGVVRSASPGTAARLAGPRSGPLT